MSAQPRTTTEQAEIALDWALWMLCKLDDGYNDDNPTLYFDLYDEAEKELERTRAAAGGEQ